MKGKGEAQQRGALAMGGNIPEPQDLRAYPGPRPANNGKPPTRKKELPRRKGRGAFSLCYSRRRTTRAALEGQPLRLLFLHHVRLGGVFADAFDAVEAGGPAGVALGNGDDLAVAGL